MRKDGFSWVNVILTFTTVGCNFLLDSRFCLAQLHIIITIITGFAKEIIVEPYRRRTSVPTELTFLNLSQPTPMANQLENAEERHLNETKS